MKELVSPSDRFATRMKASLGERKSLNQSPEQAAKFVDGENVNLNGQLSGDPELDLRL